MNTISALRAAHRRAIRENPATVTVERVTLTPENGHMARAESELGPYTVRVVSDYGRARDVTALPGAVKLSGWLLLAEHDADIQATSGGSDVQVTDTIEVPLLGRFEVKTVHPLRLHGETYGLQAVIERVQ